MKQLGDWLDRTLAFLAGLIFSFIGLIMAWALIESFTSVRLHLAGSRGAVVAVFGAISLAVAIWRGRRAGRRAASAEPGVRAPTAADRAMAAAMVEGMVKQVVRERELHDGTWPVPLSVRLVPQIPIRDQKAPRSWLGGRPRLPPAMPWPEIDGTPCDFIAQIALADLPAELWHGLGPRAGWLALFLHPTSYRGHLLVIPELGPARDAPNPPAEKDGWYNPYGWRRKDAVQQRYLLRALPEWPVDVVVSPAGETSEEEAPRDGLSMSLYKTGFDLADPAYHPFDWAGMRALADSALAALEFRYGREIPSPNPLEQQLAGLEARLAAGAPPAEAGKQPEPYTGDKIAEMKHRAAALRELIPASAEARRLGVSALAAVRQIATEIHDQAGRLPFTPQRAQALLARMQAIHWMHVARLRDPQGRPGAELIEPRVLPITVHHPDAGLFGWDYHVLHFDMARHAYCGDIASVPAATRALYEPLWRDLATKSAPQLGGFPRAHVSAFAPETDVVVLEVPSSQLMGWQFGDVDDLVLLMTREQVAAGRFGAARYEASN